MRDSVGGMEGYDGGLTSISTWGLLVHCAASMLFEMLDRASEGVFALEKKMGV